MQIHDITDGIGGVEFVGDQDGVPERELKQRLCEMFAERRNVYGAYLARVRYEGVGDAVALCLRTDAASFEEVAGSAAKIFSEMFGCLEHLDILLLEPQHDAQVLKSCTAFFVRQIPH